MSNTFNDEIREITDNSIELVEIIDSPVVSTEKKDEALSLLTSNVERIISKIYEHISKGNAQSRECIQFAIGQFDRIHMYASMILFETAMSSIRINSQKFSTEVTKSLEHIDYDFDGDFFKRTNLKISPHIDEKPNLSQLKPEIAKCLTLKERDLMRGFCMSCLYAKSRQANWDSTMINTFLRLSHIMYSICKKDNTMDVFFNFYNSILERLNTSSQHQVARDIAENILIIGYQEQLIAESYFSASRAYTGCKNPLAGLLYLVISLRNLNERKEIPQELSFQIIWQTLKIMREMHFCKQEYIDELLNIHKKLKTDENKNLWIHYTAFTMFNTLNINETANRIETFLNVNRELIYKNLEDSASPWYSLIRGLKQVGLSNGYIMIDSIEKITKQILLKTGNDRLVDLVDRSENQKKLLVEELAKIENTRYYEDIGNDSKTALYIAKNVLEDAFKKENTDDFILAMRPKSDFSFAMTDKIQKELFNAVKLQDVDGDKCVIPYCKLENLIQLMQVEQNDCMIWIGQGLHNTYAMTLLSSMFKFDEIKYFDSTKIKAICRNFISKLSFDMEIRDSFESRIKNGTDLKKESDDIMQQMQEFKIPISDTPNRINLIRDMELSAIPHQLITDERTGCFIGELKPSSNAISTEFLIKSNFNEPLSKNFTKSFWTPIAKDFTFEIVNSKLNDILRKYNFIIDTNNEPSNSLHNELNIICLHGGSNISETEWFSTSEGPIRKSQQIIGPGKLLILFACHSGSITYQSYDNSIHTIIKRYLRMGYSSVIAPMWSLSTEILPLWLESFMQVIQNGEYVIDAVFKANQEVKSKYISPAAWACLHLFGNPYLRIDEKPILQFEENR